MSGYEELERRLRESVRALGEGGGAPDGGGDRGRAARWWARARGGRRGLAVAVAAVVVVGGGVATAAQLGVVNVVHHDGAPLSARQVARQAVDATKDEQACRRLVPTTVGSKVAAVALDPRLRGLLGGGGSPAANRAAQRVHPGAVIVAGSAHVVPLGRGREIVLFATVGLGPASLADPAACGAARLAWLVRDRPDTGSPLRQKAEAILRTYRDTVPGLQMLEVLLRRSDRGAGGSGMPLGPGDVVPVGVVSSSSDGTYLGLSRAGAVRVTADAHGLHRSFAVHGRVYVVDLPHGTGPVRLRQRAADGRVVHAETVRK